MVAVVSSPTQRQFGHISRADNKSAAVVSQIHKHLCAFSRLGVFVSYVGFVYRMTDIFQMSCNGGGYVYFFDSCAYFVCKRNGVV